MSKRADLDFEVKWFPFQLNPHGAKEPSSKLKAYMAKFGGTREQVLQMARGMKERFDAVGLPFRFTDDDLIANTFDAHRVLTAAAAKGAAAQDAAAEVIFEGYFGAGKSPADPQMLADAARAAGIENPDAFVGDAAAGKGETEAEFALGRELRVRGVPHFVVRGDDGGGEQVSGAQPPAVFEQIFAQVAPKT